MSYDLHSELVQNWKQIIDYGPRPFGSDNLRKCSEYLEYEMSKITDRSYIDVDMSEAWAVDGWQLKQTASESREIKSYVFLNSGHSDGFKGRVKYAGKNRLWNMYVWDRYMITEGDEIVAYVTVRSGEDAIPQMLFQGKSDIPHFLVGESERAFFEEACHNDVIIEGYAKTKWMQNSACRNVVGHIGECAHKVVICGHYDTVYATKGAYDNSAGAAVVLEIGRRLKNYKLNAEIELLLTDGEEFDLEGAKHRCYKCGKDNIDMVLNIDGVGRQKVLEVWSGPETFERKIRDSLDRSSEEFEAVYICPPPPGSDHAPYYEKGIPVCMLTFNDQGILHSPEDDYRESLIENMEVMTRLSLDLLEQLKVIEENKEEN